MTEISIWVTPSLYEPNDLLTEIEDEAIALIREALSAIGGIDKPSQTVTDYLLLIIRHIKNHEALFRTLLVENSDPHFRRKLRAVALEMMESSFRVELDRDKKTNRLSVCCQRQSGSIDRLDREPLPPAGGDDLRDPIRLM